VRLLGRRRARHGGHHELRATAWRLTARARCTFSVRCCVLRAPHQGRASSPRSWGRPRACTSTGDWRPGHSRHRQQPARHCL
jgi:hypothetical protein